MALDPIKGGIFMLAMLGFTRSVYKRLEDYAVRKDAKKIFDARKALYTEVPEHRRLDEGELALGREELATMAAGFEGFVHLGDYVDVYAPGSAFEKYGKSPYRVERSEDSIVIAQFFRPPTSSDVRVYLITELTDGSWVVTENNRRTLVAKRERPAEMETEHMPASTPPDELLVTHRARVEAAIVKLTEHDGYRVSADAKKVDSFEDFLASHRRRWDQIRAERKQNGWVRSGEIAFPPRVKPAAQKRIYEEIAKITAYDARRS